MVRLRLGSRHNEDQEENLDNLYDVSKEKKVSPPKNYLEPQESTHIIENNNKEESYEKQFKESAIAIQDIIEQAENIADSNVPGKKDKKTRKNKIKANSDKKISLPSIKLPEINIADKISSIKERFNNFDDDDNEEYYEDEDDDLYEDDEELDDDK